MSQENTVAAIVAMFRKKYFMKLINQNDSEGIPIPLEPPVFKVFFKDDFESEVIAKFKHFFDFDGVYTWYINTKINTEEFGIVECTLKRYLDGLWYWKIELNISDYSYEISYKKKDFSDFKNFLLRKIKENLLNTRDNHILLGIIENFLNVLEATYDWQPKV